MFILPFLNGSPQKTYINFDVLPNITRYLWVSWENIFFVRSENPISLVSEDAMKHDVIFTPIYLLALRCCIDILTYKEQYIIQLGFVHFFGILMLRLAMVFLLFNWHLHLVNVLLYMARLSLSLWFSRVTNGCWFGVRGYMFYLIPSAHKLWCCYGYSYTMYQFVLIWFRMEDTNIKLQFVRNVVMFTYNQMKILFATLCREDLYISNAKVYSLLNAGHRSKFCP